MKTILTLSLLAGMAYTCQAQVISHDAERPTPSIGRVGGQLATRPLVRYLAATLQLSTTQAVAVQQALQTRPMQVRTPEQITERLQGVLTPSEYGRLLQLQANVGSYESIRHLARQ